MNETLFLLEPFFISFLLSFSITKYKNGCEMNEMFIPRTKHVPEYISSICKEINSFDRLFYESCDVMVSSLGYD